MRCWWCFATALWGFPTGWGRAALKQALTDRIKLGLDLKGGTHLVLQVHVQDAVVSTTDRDVERLQDDLQKSRRLPA